MHERRKISLSGRFFELYHNGLRFGPFDCDLTLRLFHANDTVELCAAIRKNIQELKQWMMWAHFESNDQSTLDYINRTLDGFSRNESMSVAICYDKKIIGSAGFHRFSWGNKQTSMGYWLDKDCYGKGIMTRVVKALVSHAFNDLKLHRIEIRCAEQNKKSRAIPERLGFVNEGLLRDNEFVFDHFVSHAVYSMLTTDWKT